MMKTDDINDQAITKDKIRDGNVTAEKLADGAVSTDKLPDGSIKTPKIADGNITTSKLAEASVVTSKIADQNVTKEKIADQSVDNSKLSPEAITYDKLKDKAIITEKINDRAVTTEKIDEKAITNAKIGDSAVDGRVISEASVEKKHLANDSVATEKLQDSAITADKIHIYAVTEEKIEDSAISNSKLADNSVGTSKIKDGNVTNEKVANNTITIDKFDPELRKSIQADTGLPENLVEVIQDVDVEVKSLHSKDEDLQSQIVDKQQQITANDKDIESLKNRSTQMEQSINNIAVTGGASVANTVAYSNTASGLVSINAQGAIDELAEKNATKAEKAEVTAELEKKFDKESILQESGEAEDKVMSQKAVSAKFSDLAKDSANNKQVLFPHELSYYKDITPPSLKFIPNNGIVTETTFLDGIRIFSNAGGHVLYNIATYNQETDSITTTGEYIDLGITSNGVTELFFDSAITLEKNQALVLCISANIYYDNNQSNKDIHIWNYSDSHKMWKKNIGADVAAIYIHRNTILQHKLNKKLDKTNIVQELGTAEDKVMSQKSIKIELDKLVNIQKETDSKQDGKIIDVSNGKELLFRHELSYYKDITPPSLKFIPNNGIVTETTFLDGIRIFSNAGGHVLYNIATYNQETDSITTTGEYIDLGITSNGVTELFFDSAITLEKNQALVLCISANIYYDNNQSNKDIHIWNYSDSHKMWKKNIGADVAAIYIHRNTILQHKLNKKLDKTNIVQELGTAEDKVMSQKSIKIELDKLVNIQKETDSKQDGKIIDVSNGKEFLFRHELSYYKDITNLSYFIPSFGFVSEETEIIGVRVYSQGSQLVMYTIVTLSEDGETIIEEETDRKQYGYIERGVQIIKFDNKIKLSANQGIALKFFSYYNNTPNDYIWYYSDTSKTWKKNQSAEFPFSYIYSNSLLDAYAERTFNAAVEYCDKKNENKTRVILEDISFNKNLADLVSNWKVDKVKRVISNVGTNKTDIANSIKIKKDYFIDDRRITARISPTTGVSVYIGFKYELNVFNLANVVSVDFQNNIIKVYKEVSTSITSFTALETHIEKQISIDTNYTDYIYEVLCERYGNWGVRVAVYNVTLNHKLCGELILEEFLKNRPKPVQGFMYGYPFLFTVGGNGIELHRLTVSCPTYDDVRMMIVGDSITEGYGTNDINKTYSRLLCRYIGNSIVSSRSGGTLDILNKQIVNEIPIIKPKNILIAFGHNDTWDVSDLSGFKTKLKGIIDTLTSMNINIYIACIPRTNDEHVNTSTNDAIIEVADLYGIYPIRFDIATSKNFKLTDGINTSLFYDNAHLNDKGYQIMADRFLADNDEFVKLEL